MERHYRLKRFCEDADPIDQLILGRTDFFTVNQRHVGLHIAVHEILARYERWTPPMLLAPIGGDDELLGTLPALLKEEEYH